MYLCTCTGMKVISELILVNKKKLHFFLRDTCVHVAYMYVRVHVCAHVLYVHLVCVI